MQVINTKISDVKIIAPKVFGDERGFFYESFNRSVFEDALGRELNFVQDNHSKSSKGVLRGIHYQIKQAQGKLVRVVRGEVFDIAVDLRKSSSTFGQWEGIILSSDNKRQFWVPEGFGHAFLVLSDEAEFIYKTTNYYSPEHERSIIWNDVELGIDWPLEDGLNPSLSGKDESASSFINADVFE